MGIGKKLIERCENEAASMGFDTMELVATLSGEKLYSSKGYIPLKSYEVNLGNGITNKVVSMRKHLK
jgi:predicted N-acetyltransferase YhbS